MQDNNGTLTVNSVLTRLGRHRLLTNNFNPVKFAVSDDGIDYNLIQQFADKELTPTPLHYDKVIERINVFDAWKDDVSILKSKIYKDKPNYHLPNNYFNFNINLSNYYTTNIPSFKSTITQPPVIKTVPSLNSEESAIEFHIPNDLFFEKWNKNFGAFISLTDLPWEFINKSEIWISFTLHDRKHFNIFYANRAIFAENRVKSVFANYSYPQHTGGLIEDMKSDLPITLNVKYSKDLPNNFNAILLKIHEKSDYVPSQNNVFTPYYRTGLTIWSEDLPFYTDYRIELNTVSGVQFSQEITPIVPPPPKNLSEGDKSNEGRTGRNNNIGDDTSGKNRLDGFTQG